MPARCERHPALRTMRQICRYSSRCSALVTALARRATSGHSDRVSPTVLLMLPVAIGLVVWFEGHRGDDQTRSRSYPRGSAPPLMRAVLAGFLLGVPALTRRSEYGLLRNQAGNGDVYER